ncbi:MarR family winged helix-turn-helix transcriptional regulator [Microbacterium sp. NPDC055910]|uniref:MarR family winged helix-turn-helix transcriptional regulator n=1 Tax=Microbacterium sp. NPDC055910 TaxID=3345659 RepID=UPI0035D9911D
MHSSFARIDGALIDMRRIWAPTTSGRAARGEAASVDLSTVLIVTAIGDAPDGLSVADIASELGVAPATASRLCDRAVVGGYVAKANAAADARRLSLTLTPAGGALRAQSEAFRLDYLRRILHVWTSEDVQTFERLLTRFATAVHVDPPTPPRGDIP